jgi:HlyD family secretion protein
MKKWSKYLLLSALCLGVILASVFFVKTNLKNPTQYQTEHAAKTTIEVKTVATGKVIPEDEVVIVPQLSGILQRLYVKEGDIVAAGDLLAKIKVIPDEAALSNAQGRVKTAALVLEDAKLKFKRNQTLYQQKLISVQTYNDAELALSQAKVNYQNSENDLMIIKEGTTAKGSNNISTNTIIRATVAGTVLEIPVEEGDQVTESNNFNSGTTIATIADLTKMIFEGKVDESDVNKLSVGMPLSINMAAIKDQSFKATLRFIAPKGKEENGSVQFIIRAEVYLNDDSYVRAGYSANAAMVLERKENVLAIKEALLQFDPDSGEAFVEVESGEQQFERRDITTGISDGIHVEIVSGLTEADRIKVWSATEKR